LHDRGENSSSRPRAHTNRDASGYADRNANGHADCNANGHADCDASGNTDCDANGNTDHQWIAASYADGHTDSHADRDGGADTDCHANRATAVVQHYLALEVHHHDREEQQPDQQLEGQPFDHRKYHRSGRGLSGK
jgi:hypothetical protein